jgi:MFS family permease
MATRKYGRRPTMMTSGLLFAAGAIVNGLAMNVPMLIIGRLLLGFGIGCANQVKLFFSSLFYFNYHYHLAIKCVYIENPEILNSQDFFL